jgi:enoyl-CoA hydratase/carnithine racemase
MPLTQRAEYQKLKIHAADRIGTLTLDNPARKNALSPGLVNELIWALDDAKDDPEICALVLTGAGGVFCAGADLTQMAGAPEGPQLAVRGDFADLLLRFPKLGKPVIAKISGPALAGGLGLVASCDFAVAAENAVLGTPEIHRGIFPMQIMALLDRLMPPRRLIEMILLGDKLSARQALEWGILTRVVPAEQLDAEVDQLAGALASRSPTAMRMGLAAFHQQRGKPLEESLPYLRGQLMAILGTQDAAEGLAAFMQKREPRWTGK